jgi:hypothetical protein
MKYIKTYKIFESNQIWDLEDICQEIKDEGFSVIIKYNSIQRNGSGKEPSSLGEAKLDISNGHNGQIRNDFTMVQPMRDFIFRLRDWARGEGYEIYVRSNYGMLQLTDDGRILARGCTFTPRYPSFSMMEINFAKI